MADDRIERIVGHWKTVSDISAGVDRAETSHECLLCGHLVRHDSSGWRGVAPLSPEFLENVNSDVRGVCREIEAHDREAHPDEVTPQQTAEFRPKLHNSLNLRYGLKGYENHN
jgi:hypothetical protein